MSNLTGKILIIILLLILLYVLFMMEIPCQEPMYCFDNIKKRLKTGDIILFTGKMNSVTQRLLYIGRTNVVGCIYGHAALVLRDNEKLYIVECCDIDMSGQNVGYYFDKSGKKEGGVRIIDLETMLKEYKKDFNGKFAVKFISQEIPNRIFIENLQKYQHVQFQDHMTLGILAITDLLISHKIAESFAVTCPTNRMFCTEFIHRMLHDCNVLKKYPSKLFWPHHITRETFNEIENVKYSKTYRFTV